MHEQVPIWGMSGALGPPLVVAKRCSDTNGSVR